MVLGLVAAACGAPPTTSRPTIVATTTILGDVVRQIVGDAADVEVLMPVGTDPHEFSASARQVGSMQTAVLVVANGLDLEEGLTSVLDGLEGDGVPVLRIGDLIEPRRFEDGRPDPHIWFDPERMAVAVRGIAERLAQVDDTLAGDEWGARGERYAQQVLDTEQRMQKLFDGIPQERRKLVTSHMAFGYLADRFGFEMIGVVVPGGSTLGEPSAAALADLVEVIQREQVPAIFTETTTSPKLSETLAAEVGHDVKVVTLYTGSLGEPGSGADTYIGLLETDARRITDALR